MIDRPPPQLDDDLARMLGHQFPRYVSMASVACERCGKLLFTPNVDMTKRLACRASKTPCLGGGTWSPAETQSKSY